MPNNLLIIATCPLKNDGITKIELEVAKYASKNKWKVLLSYIESDKKILKNFIDSNITCIKVRPKKNLFQYWHDIKAITKKYHITHAYIHGNSALMVLDAFPCKICHTNDIIMHSHSSSSDFPLFHYLMKPFVRTVSTKRIACSDKAGKWAFGRDYNVIVNGIDVNNYTFNDSIRKKYREEFNLANQFVIGHVGRFNEQKNHEFLIQIFDALVKKRSNCKLLLCGEGETKPRVKKQIKDLGLESKVILLEETQNINDYLQMMDCFVLPSRYEGLCLVALEVQANGLPLVASDRCSKQTNVTGNMQFVSLNDSPEVWAERICSMEGHRYSVSHTAFETKQMTKEAMLRNIFSFIGEEK